MKTKSCKCRSGLTGWRGNLRDQYANLEEFASYSETYNLTARLGFDSTEAVWEANPIVEGSVDPADNQLHREPYRLVLSAARSAA